MDQLDRKETRVKKVDVAKRDNLVPKERRVSWATWASEENKGRRALWESMVNQARREEEERGAPQEQQDQEED